MLGRPARARVARHGGAEFWRAGIRPGSGLAALSTGWSAISTVRRDHRLHGGEHSPRGQSLPAVLSARDGHRSEQAAVPLGWQPASASAESDLLTRDDRRLAMG